MYSFPVMSWHHPSAHDVWYIVDGVTVCYPLVGLDSDKVWFITVGHSSSRSRLRSGGEDEFYASTVPGTSR
jgi:hypothetical protein